MKVGKRGCMIAMIGFYLALLVGCEAVYAPLPVERSEPETSLRVEEKLQLTISAGGRLDWDHSEVSGWVGHPLDGQPDTSGTGAAGGTHGQTGVADASAPSVDVPNVQLASDWASFPILTAADYQALQRWACGRAILLHWTMEDGWQYGFTGEFDGLLAQKSAFVSTERLGEGPLYDELPTCWLIAPDGTAFASNEKTPTAVPDEFAGCLGMDYGALAQIAVKDGQLLVQRTWGFVPAGVSDRVTNAFAE